MNGKQRVYAALRRQPADRIPIFMWFQPGTRRLLAEAFEVPPPCVDDVLGNDVRMTWVNNNYCMEGIVHQHDGQSHVDPWGIQWVKAGALQPDRPISPWPAPRRTNCWRYRFPGECQEELLAQHAAAAGRRGDEYFIGCDVSPYVFEMYWRLRGLDQAVIEMAAEPELACEMLGRCGAISPPSWPRPPASASPWIGCGRATTWPASAR